MKKQTGFTLIELIVVLIIIGILAVTALPRLMGTAKTARVAAIKGLQANIISAMNLVHDKAVIQNAGDGAGAGAMVDSSGGSNYYQVSIGDGQMIWVDNGYPTNDGASNGHGGAANVLKMLANANDFSTSLGTSWLYSVGRNSVFLGEIYFVQSSSDNYKKLNGLTPSLSDLCYVTYQNGGHYASGSMYEQPVGTVKLHLGKDCQ